MTVVPMVVAPGHMGATEKTGLRALGSCFLQGGLSSTRPRGLMGTHLSSPLRTNGRAASQ